jgi:hypothetical protein
MKDVLYFNIPDPKLRLRYNPFKKVSYEKRSLVASGILDVFKKLWSDAWGVKLEHILRHSILTLLDQPSATIEDIPDKARKQEVWRDWKGEQTEPSKGMEYSLKALEEIKAKVDTFWRVYIERKL